MRLESIQTDARRAHIVSALRKAGDEGLSGQLLADELGISRAAVAKHVSVLREYGYTIGSNPGAGYVLEKSPNLPLPFEIYPLLHDQECDLIGGVETGSTNEDAKMLAQSGAPEKTIVLAGRQTAGRGRLGRNWTSPEGGIYVSFILRPKTTLSQASHLGLITGLGVLDAMRSIGASDASLKWPNDVLMPTGKLCGILLEMSAELDSVDAVIAGIGINVNRETRAMARSAYLSDTLGTLSLAEVSAVVIDAVCDIYGRWVEEGCRFEPFKEAYTGALSLCGENVTVRRIDGTVVEEGICTGVDDEGRLVVNGTIITAGDVTLKG